jgi:SAM-dependent methyltransferase
MSRLRDWIRASLNAAILNTTEGPEMELTEAKQRAKTTWAAGDYDAVVDYIWSAGGDLVERVGVTADDEVLDVACGTGNATIPAAQTGARTTGLDITPELFEGARRRAADAGVEIDWVEGDAEALPFDDASFDVVLSTFGCMFAPDHERAATEIARVLRPGGRMGIVAWTPEGGIGRFCQTLSAYAPPPPPGFLPPPLWGTRDHVKNLFDGTGVELRFEEAAVHFEFESAEAAAEEYSTKFGPIVMLREALEPEGRWDEAYAALLEYYRGYEETPGGNVRFDGEYLITLGTKAD